ncbi:MAG: hypothetical protein HYU36_10405 [Planctomycetes bacterium]|nr:hypothetical protein [Planctomycetota bacterium]
MDEATVDALGEHNLSEFPSDLTFSEPCSERDLEDYLRSLEDEGFIPSSMRRSALKLWKTLEHLSGHCLTIPGAAPGPDGKLFLVWGEGEHHFEAELIPDNPIEFFYMNRGTNETWSGEAADENEVSHEIVEKLMSLWG